MIKKKSALVTGGTAKDVAAMAVLLLNVKETNPYLADEAVIFHDGISKKDQKKINAIFPTKFIKYLFPIKDTSSFHETVTGYFSTMVFCKYECFKLLNEYHTVIWTDYDVMIRSDISELTEPTQSGFRMMPDPGNTLRKMFFESIKQIDMSKFDLESPGICTPLFVFQDTMNDYNRYYDYCIEKTREYAPYLYLPEQCIINMLLQENHIAVKPIAYDVYCVHPVKSVVTNTTKILHAYGQPKFWNGLLNDDWERYYLTWKKKGGSEYDERKPHTFRKLKKKVKRFLKKKYSLLKGILINT